MPALLSGAGASGAAADVTSTFSTAVTQVQTDVMSMISTALPIALAIGGAVIAIRLGWKFFKSMAK